MGQAYWIIEYIKVLLAYCFMIYVWPMVVFHRHLKGRSKTYTFAFCVTVSVLIINTGVLMIGLVHLLHIWSTMLIYLGVFCIQLLSLVKPDFAWIQDLRKLAAGTMGRKQLVHRWCSAIGNRLSGAVSKLWALTKNHRLEYSLLIILLIFGTTYFSWGAFDEHSYGFGDQYVHHSWVYGLRQGQIFSAGIYPAAMHCVIYVLSCFGIPTYNIVLFLAGIHIHVLLLSAYLFMKEVFHWRFSPLIALCMFLCFDQLCIDEIFSMSRLSWTLPMEYGLYTQFLSSAFLLRFLKRVKLGFRLSFSRKEPHRWRRLFGDEDIFIFAAAVSASLAIHFYVTISAFFFCVAVCIILLRELFSKGSFRSIFVSVIVAFGVAVFPMGAAFVAGYPLQGSLNWALNVIKGTDAQENARLHGDAVSQTEAESEAASPPDSGESPPSVQTPDDAPSMPSSESAPRSTGLVGKVLSKVKSLLTRIPEAPHIIFKEGYNTLYPGPRAILIVICTFFTLLSGLVMSIAVKIISKKRQKMDEEQTEPPVNITIFDGYLVAAITSVLLMILYAAPFLGLPMLVAGSRLCSSEQMVNVMLYVVPMDYLLWFLGRFGVLQIPLKMISVALTAGVYVLAQCTGIFHGYLYYELTRYNAAVEQTNKIIQTLPAQHYTIVSTTDELYQVIETGYHEELLSFIQQLYNFHYTLPTPFVFVYIEKHPIRYGQNHFSTGPSWLASEKYPVLYPETGSQCPDVLGGQITEEYAEKDIFFGAKLSDSSTSMEGRTILESKAYQWLKKFSAFFPYESEVVYEDDDFICFCIVQNVDCLFSIGVLDRPMNSETTAAAEAASTTMAEAPSLPD